MSIVTTWTTLLLTGLRGNAKTLMAVQMMDQFIKAGHPVYACNFEDLILPGVQLLDDPHGWRDLPPGSVLFVDEAQRFWRARRSGDPPQSIIEMETQRHDGVRMVLLTQQPTYLDKHLRGLVDVHRHLVRRAGLQASQVYEWERCRDEWDSTQNMEAAEQSVFVFPKEYFGMYKSAEVHTVKPKLPMRAKLLVLAALLIGGLFWYAVHKVKPSEETRKVAEAAEAVPAAGGTPSASRRRRELTREEYLAQLAPRIPGAAWSAPVFDDTNKPLSNPQVYCMIGRRCRCITEQGTAHVIPQAQCLDIVRAGGIYNPFKPDERRYSSTKEGGAAVAAGGGATPTETPSPGVVMTVPQVSGYGDIEAGTTTPATETGS